MAEIPAKLRKQRRQLEIQVAHEPGVVREIGFQGLPRITPPHVAGFFLRSVAGGGRERPRYNSEVRDGVLGRLWRGLLTVSGGQLIVEASLRHVHRIGVGIGLSKRGLELCGNIFVGGRLFLRRSLLGGSFRGGRGWAPYWSCPCCGWEARY